MFERVEYVFPRSGDSEKAFLAFKAMFHGSNAVYENDSVIFSAGADLNPVTAFRLEKSLLKHRIPFLRGASLTKTAFVDGQSTKYLPDEFFDKVKPDISAASFFEVVKELTGRILFVECTGLSVRPEMTSKAWAVGVDVASSGVDMFEHPHADGYDSTKQMWLYGIPTTRAEFLSNEMIPQQRRRQPMFSLVCDSKLPGKTVLYLDLRTRMSMAEIDQLFPHSRSLPGLENYSRTLIVDSPWPGISCVRIDLRPGGDEPPPLNGWNSGDWKRQEGEKVRPGGKHSNIEHLRV